MSAEKLSAVELETRPNPDATVIVLHGLGADGNDFVPIVQELELPKDRGIRFVFPHAPTRPVTINGGYVMRAWYDIVGVDLTNRADEAGIRSSQAIVETFIAQEKKRGIKASRIVLAGFSQGGVIALHTGLRHAEKLGGIVALSTYLAMPQKLAAEANAVNKGIPIFMAHGTADPTIRLEWAEASRKALEAEGHKVEWHTYRMQHSVSQDEVRDLGSFLRKVLG